MLLDDAAHAFDNAGALPSLPFDAFAPPAARRAPARPARDETAIAAVLRHPGVWRRGQAPAPAVAAEPTGIAALDERLPGGGWPRGALSEILVEHDGIGELGLLVPALAALTRARRRIVFVAPPYVPYAPALAAGGVDPAEVVHIDAGDADTHWTAEQCLRAGCCGAVMNWLPDADYRWLRRLQLAAETGSTLGFVFRPLAAAATSSPAALRLRVTAGATGTEIEILKCRGRTAQSGEAFRLSA